MTLYGGFAFGAKCRAILLAVLWRHQQKLKQKLEISATGGAVQISSDANEREKIIFPVGQVRCTITNFGVPLAYIYVLRL